MNDQALAHLDPVTIGILADTHGWVAPGVAAAFAGVDVIIHAGDVDAPGVLDGLRRIAPVICVRGNMDHGPWSQSLPPAALMTLGGRTFYVLHNLSGLDLVPEAAGIHVVVSGHTHAPAVTTRHGVLYLNPGSASFPRQGTAAGGLRVRIAAGRITPCAVTFSDNGGRP